MPADETTTFTLNESNATAEESETTSSRQLRRDFAPQERKDPIVFPCSDLGTNAKLYSVPYIKHA
jgi:hypothetical protein